MLPAHVRVYSLLGGQPHIEVGPVLETMSDRSPVE